MLNKILRKTVYKKFTQEDQERFIKLYSKQHIITFICIVMNIFILLAPCTNLLTISFCMKEELSIKTQTIWAICGVAYLIFVLWFIEFFKKAQGVVVYFMSCRLYSSLYTKKGKAISKKDFETIEKENDNLYDLITTQGCKGYCYSICFNILRVLKKGTMKFMAIKGHDEDKEYTMHVLYVNNDWAFDTNSQRQFPLEELINIYEAKVYKDFTFEDIKGISYDDFRDLIYSDLEKWSEENGVSQYMKKN